MNHDQNANVEHSDSQVTPREKKYGPFTEAMQVDGELIGIGGAGPMPHAYVVAPDGKRWRCTVSRETAQAMAPYLYRGSILRLHGHAHSERREDGKWHHLWFKVSTFEVMPDETLEEVVQRIRSLGPTGWDTIEDVDAYIAESRGHNA